MTCQAAIQILHALAHSTRWRLAERLLEQAINAEVLAKILNLPRTTVSDHLQVMRRAGLLAGEQRGRLRRYRVIGEHAAIIPALRNCLGIALAGDQVLSADAWNSQYVARS